MMALALITRNISTCRFDRWRSGSSGTRPRRFGASPWHGGFLELPIDAADAELAGELDWSHRDPFDRKLVARCLNRDPTLVTTDARLGAWDEIAVMWAG